LDGSLCQYEEVEVGVGSGAREDSSCCVICSEVGEGERRRAK
jgi:hypothetical protein